MEAITENKIIYKLGKPPMNLIMAGILLILFGIFLIMKLWFLKIPLLIAGIGILISRDRLAIDFENRRIMKYVLFFGFRLGKWQSVEQAQYISLVRVRMRRKENFLTIGTQRTRILVKANIIFPKKQYITLFKDKAEKAFTIVKAIALGFGLDVYDMTGKKKYKIPPNILYDDF